MTKAEFLTGWTILTTQPWGKVYRGTTLEATVQVEFYYKHVDRANPDVWVSVCESAAQGDRWPSLSDLKSALQAKGGYMQVGQRQLTHEPVYSDCPPEVREQLNKLKVNI